MSFFSPEEKLVFCYMLPDAGPTGARQVYADPLEVRRRLIQVSHGEFDQALTDAAEPEKPDAATLLVQTNAQEKLVSYARQVFELPPISREKGEGYTEAVVLNVLYQFLEWLEKNVSSGATTPTS